MAQGPQKPDHGGNYFMVPRRLLDSVAWRHLSLRARVVLQVLMARHNGFNNGTIGCRIIDICEALGDQNKGANGLAVAELIELGFIECMSDANRHQSKSREYRITFVSTGQGKTSSPATNEYLDWRPAAGKTRKFRGTKNAPPTMVSGAINAPPVKFSGAINAPQSTESRGFEHDPCGANNAPHISNQSTGFFASSSRSEISPPITLKPRAAEPACVPVDELREWMKAVITSLRYGGQRSLATDADIPEPALSRFKAGKNLPDHYRLPLQHACGRALPYVKWKAAAA